MDEDGADIWTPPWPKKCAASDSHADLSGHAQIENGGAEIVREHGPCGKLGVHAVKTLWQDLKFGLRLLRLNRGFAAAAILSLALAMWGQYRHLSIARLLELRTLR